MGDNGMIKTKSVGFRSSPILRVVQTSEIAPTYWLWDFYENRRIIIYTTGETGEILPAWIMAA